MKRQWWLLLCLLLGLLTHGCRCSRAQQGSDGKKVLYYRAEGVGGSIDPQEQFDTYSSETVALLYDSLFMYHYLKRPYELVPNLAAAMPEYSDDGRTMTIRLRDDVTFNDDRCFAGGRGRAFVADDVVYMMKRFGDVNVNTEGSVTLVEGLIEGFDDYVKASKDYAGRSKELYAKEISGIKAIDAHTVQFQLTKKTPVVFYVLGVSLTGIPAKECVEFYGEDMRTHPVGTGAFKLSYLNRKGDVVLKKNPRYHLKYPSEGEPGDLERGLLADAGKQLPLVDEVVIPVIQENQPAMLKFLRGYFDWVRLDADSFADMAVKNSDGSFSLKDPYSQRYELFPAVDLSAFWLLFNMKDPIVGKNKKLRQAMAHAFNRDGFVTDLFNGRGVVIDSMVPSTIAGNSSDVGAKWYPYDVEKAKQLMIEAGYPGGKGLPVLRYFYSTGPTVQRQFEYMRRNFAEIGIKLELDTTQYSGYLKKFQSGDFQITQGGWNADYLDAENFMMLFSKAALDNHLYYGGAWFHPEYESLLKKMRELANGPERYEVIKRMLEIIKEEAPYVPIFTYNRIGLRAPWLKNWKRNTADRKEAIYVDIDVERRAKGTEE